MCRLALGLPTALQVDHSFAILFHEDGVSELTHLDNQSPYLAFNRRSKDRHNRIWALVDSNESLPRPADIFIHSSPFFVVNVVSPRSDHLGWLQKNRYDQFHMKPWSGSEVLQAYVDSGL